MNDEQAARRPGVLRAQMADQLVRWGIIGSAQVEAAVRAVPRHLFVPGVPVDQAYANEAVVTHRDSQGVAVSSASAPGVVAMMLEQLRVEPGHRVLEIGAGTGYNAALLACMVGPAGKVATVEIDRDVTEAARRALREAGYGRITVSCRDGESGYPEQAPFDRIVITAGAWDISPAWTAQLAPGGRLVVPLRIRGVTRSVAFDSRQGVLRGQSVEECGFVPVRGVGGVAEHNVLLDGGNGMTVRVDDGRIADAGSLAGALGHPPVLAWTGVRMPWGACPNLDFWLASMPGFCRVLAARGVPEQPLIPPAYPWGSMGVAEAGTVAYLTLRPAGEDDAARLLSEVGVCAYGPEPGLAERVADRVRAWFFEGGPEAALEVEVYPAGTGRAGGALLVADKHHTRVVVRASGDPVQDSSSTASHGVGTRRAGSPL